MLEAYGTLRPIEISACAPCNLFWFDKSESVRLTPKAVLEVFQFIGRPEAPANSLATQFNCPLCSAPLALTQDLQRTTRFTYWRCRNDHGQLITFHQFLREKNFIRAPSPAELAKLRATVRQVACSQCGAPVDLATDSACTHCGAPVALIDPDGVAKALRELAAGASVPASSDPDAMRTTLSDAQIDAIFDLAARCVGSDGDDDLVAIGAAAIGALIAGFSRRSETATASEASVRANRNAGPAVLPGNLPATAESGWPSARWTEPTSLGDLADAVRARRFVARTRYGSAAETTAHGCEAMPDPLRRQLLLHRVLRQPRGEAAESRRDRSAGPG